MDAQRGSPPRTHGRKSKLLLSGALISLFLVSVAYGSILNRWGDFRALFVCLTAGIIWIVWIVHLGWIMIGGRDGSSRRLYRWGGVIGGALTSIVASRLVGQVGSVVRSHEIQASVNAGLREDCITLLLNWPVKEDRIFQSEPQFEALPTSIKMLTPVYVTNERTDDPNLPPNVGLCKHGFGGFAMGVRVFRNDDDADKYKSNTEGGCERIAPGVYYWWHPT